MAPLSEQQAAAEAAVIERRIAERVDAALTSDVLSRLAFKGISPQHARAYLAQRARLAVVQQLAPSRQRGMVG